MADTHDYLAEQQMAARQVIDCTQYATSSALEGHQEIARTYALIALAQSKTIEALAFLAVSGRKTS